MRKTWVRSLCGEDPLEKGKAPHSSILAWRILWTVWSMGSQRVRQDWATFTFTFQPWSPAWQWPAPTFQWHWVSNWSFDLSPETESSSGPSLGGSIVRGHTQPHPSQHFCSQITPPPLTCSLKSGTRGPTELPLSSPSHPQFHCPLETGVFLQNLFSNLNLHSNHLGTYSSANSESAWRGGLQHGPSPLPLPRTAIQHVHPMYCHPEEGGEHSQHRSGLRLTSSLMVPAPKVNTLLTSPPLQ